MTYALIDGDICCYRAAIVQEERFQWSSECVTTTVTGSAQKAAEMALELVKAWTRLAGCKRSIVAFTGSNNFRKRLLPSYKSNRKSGKPLVYEETVMAVADRYRTERVAGLEGDDILGILGTNPKYQGSVIVSLDKDMKTLPGRFYNPGKGEGILEMPEREADRYWMMQTLMGDTSDGYKGLPGCGVVKAERILGAPVAPLQALWRRVVEAYTARKLTQADALTQARVARILRFEDWNKDTKQIRLWHPATPEWIASVETDNAVTD